MSIHFGENSLYLEGNNQKGLSGYTDIKHTLIFFLEKSEVSINPDVDATSILLNSVL